MVMPEKKKGRPSRFRLPKSASKEQVLADEVQKQMGLKTVSGMAAAKGDGSTDFRSRWSFQRL